MKDVQTPLRTLIFGLLTSLGLEVFEAEAVPEDQPTPFVVISSISSNENSNKSDFGNSVQLLLDVVTSYPKNTIGGSKQADTIAGQILGVINSKTKFAIFDGLQIVTTKIIQDTKLNSSTDTHVIYRRALRYSQLIMEV